MSASNSSGPIDGAERGDQRADLLRREHLVEARPLDVEDLAAQRQHRLVLAVAALLGRAAGRIALDDEEFGLGRVALLAVGELAGQRGDVERALAPRQLARLARRLARGGRLDHLADDRLGLRRMLLEPGAEPLVDRPSTTGRTSEETSLSLVCEENFGSGTLTESTAVSPSRQSSPVSATFSFLAMPCRRHSRSPGASARRGSRRDACRRRAAGCCW